MIDFPITQLTKTKMTRTNTLRLLTVMITAAVFGLTHVSAFADEAELRRDIEQNRHAIENQAKKLDEFDKVLKNHGDRIKEISDTADANAQTALQAHILASQNEQLARHQQETLLALGKADQQINNQLKQQAEHIRAHEAALEQAKQKDQQTQDQVAQHSANLSRIDQKLERQAENLTGQAQSLEQLKQHTESQANQVRQNQQAIQALQQSVPSHEKLAQIDRNAERIGQLSQRLSDLDREVQRGLAAQAALSGLFQPYGVGKVNLSAALGGYRSQTAVAVGAGYRFNEMLAAKTGVAFNVRGGGVSYNLGVNLEW